MKPHKIQVVLTSKLLDPR